MVSSASGKQLSGLYDLGKQGQKGSIPGIVRRQCAWNAESKYKTDPGR